MVNLKNYGFDEFFNSQAQGHSGLIPARITGQHKNSYTVITPEGTAMAELSGRFLYTAEREDYPVVGDFVMLIEAEGISIIHHCLKRKGLLQRRQTSGERDSGSDIQGIAANIDIVFICMALDRDFNLSRLERYISITWTANARPVVILTKKDITESWESRLAETESANPGIDILVTSQFDEVSISRVREYISEGKTAVFAGSSGVGKTTLINALLHEKAGETKEISSYGKGKHTTTSRELFLLNGGGCLIDTPGMRELGVDYGDVGTTFSEIEELARHCRFNDCTHTGEPGCAVQEAVESGNLDRRRYENYLRLKKESRYVGLNSREIEDEKLNTMLKDIGGKKNMKKFIKEKNSQKGR